MTGAIGLSQRWPDQKPALSRLWPKRRRTHYLMYFVSFKWTASLLLQIAAQSAPRETITTTAVSLISETGHAQCCYRLFRHIVIAQDAAITRLGAPYVDSPRCKTHATTTDQIQCFGRRAPDSVQTRSTIKKPTRKPHHSREVAIISMSRLQRQTLCWTRAVTTVLNLVWRRIGPPGADNRLTISRRGPCQRRHDRAREDSPIIA